MERNEYQPIDIATNDEIKTVPEAPKVQPPRQFIDKHLEENAEYKLPGELFDCPDLELTKRGNFSTEMEVNGQKVSIIGRYELIVPQDKAQLLHQKRRNITELTVPRYQLTELTVSSLGKNLEVIPGIVNCPVAFIPDARGQNSHMSATSDFPIVVTHSPNSIGFLEILLHENGHYEDFMRYVDSIKPKGEDVSKKILERARWDYYRPTRFNNRDFGFPSEAELAEILRQEREAWASALKHLRPILGPDLRDSTSRMIHNYGLQSHSNRIRYQLLPFWQKVSVKLDRMLEKYFPDQES